MAYTAGSILYNIAVNTQQLVNATRTVSTSTAQMAGGFNTVSGSMQSMGSVLTKVAMGVGTALAGMGIAARIGEAMDYIDVQQKLARQLDTTYGSLQILIKAGKEYGIGADEMADAVKDLNEKLGEASYGVAEAKKFFDDLGLSVQELEQMNADEKFKAIAMRMKELGLSTEQSSAYLAEMGIGTKEMVLMMQDGGSAIDNARKKMEELGLTLNEVDTAKVEEANRSVAYLSEIFDGVINKIAVELAPLIAEFANSFGDVSDEGETMGQKVDGVLDNISWGLGKVGDALRGWQIILKGVEGAYYALAAGINKVLERIAVMFEALINKSIAGVNDLINAFNTIPGASELGLKALERYNNDAKNVFAESTDYWVQKMEGATNEINTLLEKPLPSKKLEELNAKWDEMGQNIADNNEKIRNTTGDGFKRASEVVDEAKDKVAEFTKKLEEQREELGKSDLEIAKLRASRELEGKATAEQMTTIYGLLEAMDQETRRLKEQQEALDNLKKAREEAYKEGRDKLNDTRDKNSEFTRNTAIESGNPEGVLGAEQSAEIKALEDARNYEIEFLKATGEQKLAIENEYNRAIEEAKARHNGEMQKLTEMRKEREMGAYADLFGAIANISANGNKKMFAIHKMASLSQAIISGVAAVQKAYAEGGWPAGIAMGVQTAANVMAIQKQQYGGGRMYGGPVEAGKYYRVNETGAPEIYSAGGRDYLMATENAKVKPASEVGTGGGGWSGNIIVNNAPPGTTAEFNGTDVIVQIARDEAAKASAGLYNRMTGEVASNQGKFYTAMTRNTTVRGRPES